MLHPVSANDGNYTKLFSQILTADTSLIDTGATIPGGFDILEVFIVARTQEVAETSAVQITFNNDTGANYDVQRILGQNATASAANSLAQSSVGVAICGDSAHAGAASTIRFTIPAYSSTTFHKVGEMTNMLVEDTAATCRVDLKGFRWRNTAAITRIAFTPTTGFKLGSCVYIYGR